MSATVLEEGGSPRPPADIPMTSMMPGPDSTALTTAAVDRAVAQWRRDLQALREILETRITAIDEATKIRAESINGAPGRIAEEITHLRELVRERFDGVDAKIGAQREFS